MLTVLETLAPAERAVFVLREVFDIFYEEIAEAVGKSPATVRHGDPQGLLDVLVLTPSPSPTEAAPAVRRPIQGAERGAGLLIGLRSVDFEIEAVWLNGSPGARIDIGGHFTAAVSLAVEHGRITHICAISNPLKLGRLDGVAAITQS